MEDGPRAEEADAGDDLRRDPAAVLTAETLADLAEQDDSDHEEHVSADARRAAIALALISDRAAEQCAEAELDQYGDARISPDSGSNIVLSPSMDRYRSGRSRGPLDAWSQRGSSLYSRHGSSVAMPEVHGHGDTPGESELQLGPVVSAASVLRGDDPGVPLQALPPRRPHPSGGRAPARDGASVQQLVGGALP